ncbi:hypothetical protein ACFY0G_16490 [Streptomyces sp. NPDC001552]|uniref:hypothetical protein n=1 Tax=Streptomyces sp. NPDC001552 TaxID=3364587 RepID=UPI0036B23ADC
MQPEILAADGRLEAVVRRILAERFARCEIDDEEYGRRLALLRSRATGPTPL